MVRNLFAVALLGATTLSAIAADTKYALTGDNTKLTFVGKKPDGKHDGAFPKLSGTATVANNDLTTLKLEVDIDAAALTSDDAKLTEHLKSPDFFDVKNNPKASFKVTKVAKGDGVHVVTGDLTLHGKTKSITFPASITEKDGVLSVSTTFWIDRTQWDMTYGKGKVDDKVEVTIKVTAKK